MSARAEALWTRMRANGTASGDAPAGEDTPWYLAALAGIAAWVAAIFLVGFFFTLFDQLWRAPTLAFPLGAGCCVFAIVVLRHARGREFFEQFAIAASLTGQLLIGMAFENWLRFADKDASSLASPDWRLVWSGVGLVALAMYALGRPRMHRLLCGGILAVALIGVCFGDEDGQGRFAVPLLAWTMLALWWRSAAQDRLAPALPPMAWATSLIALMVVWFADAESGGLRAVDPEAAAAKAMWSQALIVPLLPLCASWLLSRQAADLSARRRILGLVLAAAFALLWWRAPGVSIGVCLTLIGFALYRPALLVVGMCGLGVYLLRYYYQLDVSLTEKSWWLVGSGAVLLATRWLLSRSAREETT